MRLIIGLGNPGEKYKYTRHNIGFMVLEKLAKEILPVARSEKAWIYFEKWNSQQCQISKDLILIKPQSFMNRSGVEVAKMVNFFKVNLFDLWVIHDDIDLPLGKIRIRIGGASAGHRGIESIIRNLSKNEFVRFRLGIGRGKMETLKTSDINLHRRAIEKYVVSPFKDSEGGEVKKMIKNAVEAIKIALDKGLEKAMNRFN